MVDWRVVLSWALQKEYLEVGDRVVLTGDVSKAGMDIFVPSGTQGVITKIFSWTDKIVLVQFSDWVYPTNRDYDPETGDSRGWYVSVQKLRLL